jgi:RimJ/RimL family protein N-acetyltransferase
VDRPPAERLRTARLFLEPLTADDAAALAEEMAPVLADPALYRFTGGGPPEPGELRRRYAAQAAGTSPDGSQGWLNWIVRERSTGSVVGFVQATVEERAGAPVAELAWVVGTGGQGRGVATEAAAAMLTRLRRHGVGTVTASIHPGNGASARVAVKLGLAPTDAVVDGETRWMVRS